MKNILLQSLQTPLCTTFGRTRLVATSHLRWENEDIDLAFLDGEDSSMNSASHTV